MDRRLIFIILACGLSATAFANGGLTYMSSNVARIAAALPPISADSLRTGCNYVKHNGLPLTIRVNENGHMEHIGIKIFSETMRDAKPLPVYDLIEQGYLKYKLGDTMSTADDDGLKFSVGSWDSLDHVSDSTPVEVACTDNDRYTLTWGRQGDTIARIEVPVKYDLFQGVDRQELERIYLRDLAQYANAATATPTQTDKENLIALSDSVSVRKGNIHIQENINSDIYFVLAHGESYDVLFDARHPMESLVNVFNAADRIDTGKLITVKFNLYGNKKETLTVPVRQLMAYSASLYESAYVGVERVTDAHIEMSLFLDNPAAGYEHVFFIRANADSVTDPGTPLYGEAYLYSPTKYKSHNDNK